MWPREKHSPTWTIPSCSKSDPMQSKRNCESLNAMDPSWKSTLLFISADISVCPDLVDFSHSLERKAGCCTHENVRYSNVVCFGRAFKVSDRLLRPSIVWGLRGQNGPGTDLEYDMPKL